MEFNELIESLKSFEGSAEFDNFISGYMTNDRINAFLDTSEGKDFLQPRLDRHFDKSLKTWQTNHLEQMVNDRVKELYPDKDPKDAKVAELEAQIKQMQAEALHKDLTNKALSIANEKGLPTKLIRHFIGKDEAETTANLGELEAEFSAALESKVTERLGKSHKPAAGDTKRTLSPEDLANLSIDEINEYYKENYKTKSM